MCVFGSSAAETRTVQWKASLVQRKGGLHNNLFAVYNNYT